MTKLESLQKQVEKAIASLELACTKISVKDENYQFFRDSVIQRFEFSYELLWKFLKEKLQNDFSVEALAPKMVLIESLRLGLIVHEDFWFRIHNNRNLTSHTYVEETAEEVLSDIPDFILEVKSLLKKYE